MKNIYKFTLTLSLILSVYLLSAQTSWKGTISTAWSNPSNWTLGVPTSTMDVIIGDANFTGANQPTISATAICKSLIIGGTKASTLTISKSTTVSGNITIAANGTISHGGVSLSLTGNWINNGSYSATSTNSNVLFAGTAQSLQGSNVTTFRKLTVNAGSTTTLNTNVTLSGASSTLYVKGTLDPGDSPTYKITGLAMTTYINAKLKIKGATFADNYTMSGTVTFNAGSTAEYGSISTDQIVNSSYTYSTLIISGSGIKSLTANLPSLRSTAATYGNIYVNAGAFDLSSFTANRGTSTSGGTISVANGATLKIGGTNTFPANFSTNTLSLSSIVEYNGTNQTVSAKTYGNLKLSSSSGAATKTFPTSAFTVIGDFTSLQGLGTSVIYTIAANLTVNGQVNIGANTTFNGSSFTINAANNWTNNGTFTGNTGTVNMTGAGSTISGTGAHNFNNLSIGASGITAAASSAVNVSGNFSTTGPGAFTHTPGGTFTMTGSSKTISGTNITLDNFSVTGSVTTTSSLLITGSLAVSGSFAGSNDNITMSGSSKTISGAGTISFSALQITGTVSSTASFFISSSLDISGTLSATAGTATFTGTSTLNGTANLYNVTINGTSLILSANAILGIANVFTITAGSLNVTSNIPNTVSFNGTGTQNVNNITYHHLSLVNGSTKTAAGAITVNGNLSIGSSTTFSGSSFTHTLYGHWINGGTFTPATSTITLAGASNTYISGATTFNVLTVNKSASTTVVTLQNNISVPTINMTSGMINTGANTLTITTTRTGNGIILGTITRTHTFSIGVAYAFEGPDNTITFSTVSGVTSVTVNITIGNIADFPNGGAINRVYNTTIPAGTYTATLRLHYEDAELNGASESTMQLWKYNGTAWVLSGKTTNSTSSNYVEQVLLSNITNRWTCSDNPSVVKWTGSSSSDWNTASNWTPATVPTSTDIAQIGSIAFTNNPTISNAASVKSLSFGSTQAATLTITTGGSLTTSGNITGTWSANATHTINAGNQNITVNGDMILSDGTTGHAINLSAANSTITVNGSVTETGGANINFTGNTSLSIKNDFNYTSGVFSAGTGTVTYNGTGAQIVAPLTYYNLTINKASGTASANATTSVGGNLTITSGGIDLNANTTVSGNISVAAAGLLYGDAITLTAGGNWSNSGSFLPGTGTVIFNGAGSQSISSSTFNAFIVNKVSGTATLTGNITINNTLDIQAGTFDLSTYTANRSATGGQLSIASGATLLAGGSNNFPQNYTNNSLNAASTVNYNGSGLQTVTGVSYGHLIFSNGGSNAKTLSGSLSVGGDITLNSGTTVDASSYTITLSGNWSNGGTFIPSSGTVVLMGSAKTITGTTVFNKVTVYGSYTVAGSDITYNGLLYVTATGSYAAGSGTATVNGDLTNSGTLTSTGTTTFSGTSLQTIRLVNALVSTSTGVVNFNGNVSPVFNSTTTPIFANLNISNTAGINPSVNWRVIVSMTINSGGVFNGGNSTHTINGSFTNNGVVTSDGIISFEPTSAVAIKLSGTSFSSTGSVNFGGTGQITITGAPTALDEVRITNTNTAGITPPSGWTMAGDFIIANNSIFNAGSYTYNVGGDIESNGTLNGGSSTFIMSSAAGLLTGSPNTTFNHFTITGDVTANSDFNVAGNFTNNGTYDGSIGTLIMTGSNNSIIGGTTVPSTIAQLTIAKTGASTLTTLSGNISDVFTLYINSGTLFTSTNNITQDPSGGLLMVSNGATLKLGGTNSLPGFSAFFLDIYSTVEYAGTSQLVGNAASYGNLMVTASGNKLAMAPLIVQNDFTLSAGTFVSNVSVTHTIGGNWTMSGGTFLNASSTIVFNGSGDQYITSTGAFNNLTVNKSTGLVILSGNVAVNAITNLTAGKISLDNYNYTIGTSGSISGANSSNYFIAVGAGSLIQQVVAGNNKTFPVGLTNAYTPATIALTGSSTTDNFSIRMLTEAYAAGTSGTIINANSVRATWMIAENVVGGSDATVTLQWPLSLEQSGFVRSFCRLAHYTSGSWDYGVSDISSSGSNPYSLGRSGFTSFSPFIVTKIDPLPVTWLNISGTHKNDDNYITWSTAAEMNNEYFVVEASKDGFSYTEIGRVSGNGNTNTTQQYSYIHKNTTGTTYYYRIKQVDIDGKYSFSSAIKIKSEGKIIHSSTLSPNPVYEQSVLSMQSEKSATVTLTIIDFSGKIVSRRSENLIRGNNPFIIDLSGKPAGVYVLKITSIQNETLETIQFVHKL